MRRESASVHCKVLIKHTSNTITTHIYRVDWVPEHHQRSEVERLFRMSLVLPETVGNVSVELAEQHFDSLILQVSMDSAS
jgi:hypothetical protein